MDREAGALSVSPDPNDGASRGARALGGNAVGTGVGVVGARSCAQTEMFAIDINNKAMEKVRKVCFIVTTFSLESINLEASSLQSTGYNLDNP